jgi:hypothetical protein
LYISQMDEKLKSHVKVLVDLANEKSDKLYAWYKQVLLMASGLLSILIALHSKRSDNFQEHLMFVVTVISLSVGIVTGSIFLFSEVSNIDRARKEYAEQASKYVRGEIQGNIFASGETAKVFVFCEWLSYIAFLIAICSLCYYAILSDMLLCPSLS